MKKLLLNFLLLFWAACLFAQNTKNIYADQTGNDPDVNASGASWECASASYSGEYQFFNPMNEWEPFQTWKGFVDGVEVQTSLEVVSFPFCPIINFDAPAERKLNLAQPSSEEGIDWTFAPPIGEDWIFSRKSSVGLNTLVSKIFASQQEMMGNIGGRTTFPHSIFKIRKTIYCGNDANCQKIGEYSFIIDNTRGRMKFYPFVGENYMGGSFSSWYDIVIWSKLEYPSDFNATSNAFGTINYFPNPGVPEDYCTELGEPYLGGTGGGSYPCVDNQNKVPLKNPDGSYMSEDDGAFPINEYAVPAPFSVPAFDLRDAQACNPAGYRRDANNKLVQRDGIEHEYLIDRSFDIRQLSPEEKVVYNPSEVSIITNGGQPTTLTFPCGYTFQTVRGLHATQAEVTAAMAMLAPLVYHDLRDVPVPTDLEHSIYNVEANATLEIEPCVVLNGADVHVKTGGTLIYYPQFLYGANNIVNEGGNIIERSFSLRPFITTSTSCIQLGQGLENYGECLTYAWSPQYLLDDPTLQFPTAQVGLGSTNFTLVITGEKEGCSISLSQTVTYSSVPSEIATMLDGFSNDMRICENTDFTVGYTGNLSGAYTFHWKVTDGMGLQQVVYNGMTNTPSITLNLNTLVVNMITPYTVTLTITDSFGCEYRATKRVWVYPSTHCCCGGGSSICFCGWCMYELQVEIIDIGGLIDVGGLTPKIKLLTSPSNMNKLFSQYVPFHATDRSAVMTSEEKKIFKPVYDFFAKLGIVFPQTTTYYQSNFYLGDFYSFLSIAADKKYISPESAKAIQDALLASPKLQCERKREVEEEVLITEGFSVAPNPVKNGNLTVQITATQIAQATIEIIDNQGRVVFSEMENTLAKGSNFINLNISNVASGIYFVKLATINSENSVKIQSKKVVIIN